MSANLRSIAISATVLALITVGLNNPANANSPKPGATCPKAGATAIANEKKFTCIKSGKKLVWNKGVKTKSSAPLPATSASTAQSPTTNPSPKPTPVTITSRWKKTNSRALNSFEKWSSNLVQGSPKSKIEYWFGPQLSEPLKTEAQRRMDNAVLQWERFFSVSRTRIFFDLGFYTDMQAICERIAARSTYRSVQGCLRQIKGSQEQILYHAAAWESEGGYVPTVDPNLSVNALVNHNYALQDERIFYTSSFLPRIEHEWFHQIQFDLTGNNYVREYPCWFLEGSSEYFGSLAALGDNSDNFLQHRAQSWIAFEGEATASNIRKWVEDASIPKLAAGSFFDQCSKLQRPQTIYKFGAVLTEWMVGKIGIADTLKIVKDTESLGWNSAFKKYIGKSMADSYEEMANYLYTELRIMEETKPWIALPRCPTYKNANFGVCFSDDIRQTT